jgi:PIN domain nuclease of toxin-antitoxin system
MRHSLSLIYERVDRYTYFSLWNSEDAQLSLRAKGIIADGHNEVFLSAASVWEIVIKTAKGRLVLPEPPDQYISKRMN